MSGKGYALFAAIPFSGHLNPLLQQAAELSLRGWSVNVASVEEARPRVEQAGAGIEFLPVGSTETMPDIYNELQKAVHANSFLGSALQTMYCINRLWPVMYDGLRAAIQRRRPDVMVADVVTTAALDAAAGLPTVVNNPDLLDILPKTILPLDPRLPLAFFDKSIREVRHWRTYAAPMISFISSQLVRWTWMRDLNLLRASRGLKHVDFADLLRGKLILNDSAFGLEYPRTLPPHLQMVGPMIGASIDPLPPDYQEWLDRSESCIYVNMGTICRLTPDQLQQMLAALSCEEFRVLWILSPDQRKLLPPTLPEGIRIQPWGPPPISILRHPNVKAFVCHCGVNSVHEAMHAGTPVVGIPMFADQCDMGARVQDAGVGLILDKQRLTARQLQDFIRRVIQEEQFRQAIIPVQESFRLAGGVRRAADLIESAAM